MKSDHRIVYIDIKHLHYKMAVVDSVVLFNVRLLPENTSVAVSAAIAETSQSLVLRVFPHLSDVSYRVVHFGTQIACLDQPLAEHPSIFALSSLEAIAETNLEVMRSGLLYPLPGCEIEMNVTVRGLRGDSIASLVVPADASISSFKKTLSDALGTSSQLLKLSCVADCPQSSVASDLVDESDPDVSPTDEISTASCSNDSFEAEPAASAVSAVSAVSARSVSQPPQMRVLHDYEFFSDIFTHRLQRAASDLSRSISIVVWLVIAARAPAPEPAPVAPAREYGQLFVKNLCGRSSTFEVHFPSCTVCELKDMILDRGITPPDQTRLVYGGKELQDGRLLADYGVRHECTLHLVLRL